MKRRFAILLTALLLLSGEGAAQLIRSFGVKAGAVTATQSYDYENSPDLTSLGMDYRWGVVAGVFARTGSLSLFSLSAEVMYIQKGFRTEALVASPSFPDGWGETITITPRADYLSIPVFLHAGFDAAALSPYLFAGPRLDFLVYRNQITPLSSTEFGVTLGAGLTLHPGILPDLLVEARYSPGIVDVGPYNFSRVRNTSVEFLAGMAF